MNKTMRSYFLPGKLLAALEKECAASGYFREKVVAAAMLDFLDSDPEARARKFERLDRFLRGKKKK